MTLSERLRELVRRCKEDGIEIRFTDILEAASLLESKWRPISDKTGFDDCWDEGVWIFVDGYSVVMATDYYKGNRFLLSDGRLIHESRVTHWQPVVAPEVPE